MGLEGGRAGEHCHGIRELAPGRHAVVIALRPELFGVRVVFRVNALAPALERQGRRPPNAYFAGGALRNRTHGRSRSSARAIEIITTVLAGWRPACQFAAGSRQIAAESVSAGRAALGLDDLARPAALQY
jgi:hypothetical protein